MKVQRIGKKEEQVKAKRLHLRTDYGGSMVAIDGIDADRLEAAIARKDAALHRCVEAIEAIARADRDEWDKSAPWDNLYDAGDAAKAALEET